MDCREYPHAGPLNIFNVQEMISCGAVSGLSRRSESGAGWLVHLWHRWPWAWIWLDETGQSCRGKYWLALDPLKVTASGGKKEWERGKKVKGITSLHQLQQTGKEKVAQEAVTIPQRIQPRDGDNRSPRPRGRNGEQPAQGGLLASVGTEAKLGPLLELLWSLWGDCSWRLGYVSSYHVLVPWRWRHWISRRDRWKRNWRHRFTRPHLLKLV